MPALQVKDFPQDLYDKLKACAVKEDRSISQQTVHILRGYLQAYHRLAERSDWEIVPKTSGVLLPYHEQALIPQETEEAKRQTYLEKRKRVFEEISAFPHPEIPDDFPSPAELVRQEHEERDSRITPEMVGF